METTEMMEVDKNPESSGNPDEGFAITWACPHIRELKTEDMLTSYEMLHAFYVSCIAKCSSQKKKKTKCVCNVKSCKKKREKIHACLSCIYFGCFKRHIKYHAARKKHFLAMDIDFGNVFCYECNDYQYDADFYNIAQKNNLIASHQRSIEYKWKPTPEEIYLLTCHDIEYNYKMGARGIINDGGSCYLNVLVQALIHSPTFRDYLFSLEHKCKFIKNEEKIRVPVCFVCEMAFILQEYFSDKKGPMALGGLHYLFMKLESVRDMINYQNDCSEFIDIFLTQLHENSHSETLSEDSLCNCIIHTMFAIPFSRKRTCNECKSVFVKEQHEWKITLYEKAPENDNCEQIVPLKECLKSYYYGEISDYHCSACDNRYALYITEELPTTLPSVLSFALIQGFSVESDCFVQYDEFLDMSDFVLPSEADSREYKYYLIAVIEYIRVDSFGSKSSRAGSSSAKNSEEGHYISYVRLHANLWFKCDDVFITEIDIKEVLQKKARMLFYQKMYL